VCLTGGDVSRRSSTTAAVAGTSVPSRGVYAEARAMVTAVAACFDLGPGLSSDGGHLGRKSRRL
jgi:hypothetical protein